MGKFIKSLLRLVPLLLFFNLNLSCKKNTDHRSNGIVSLAPSITEILFALGAGDRIVGVTIFCDYPSEVKKIEKVGDFINPSIEKIVSLSPGIVFAVLPSQYSVVEKLKKLGINVIAFDDPSTLEELYAQIDSIGKLVGEKRRADSLVEFLKKSFKELKTEKTLNVYVEISDHPLITIGRDSYLNSLFKEAGIINIFEDLQGKYPIVNPEQVIKRNPDVIIVLHPVEKEDILKRPGWEKMKAIQKANLITDVNPSLLLRPGPRLAKGLKEVLNRIK